MSGSDYYDPGCDFKDFCYNNKKIEIIKDVAFALIKIYDNDVTTKILKYLKFRL